MIFVCPKCRGKLRILPTGTAVCEMGHTYDRSREGYYNLLLSSSSGVHGDNILMVEARRRFLEAGFYFPLADKVCKIAKELIGGGVVVDAGCGEGYYTGIISRALMSCFDRVSIGAFDISKDAVRRASKRVAGVNFSVASAYKMPIEDSSVDLLINIFSPMAKEEALRVIKPSGHFLIVIPAEEHLFELKETLYKNPYKNRPEDTSLDGFELVFSQELLYDINLPTKEDILNLFMMTPYAYRTANDGKEKLLSLESLKTKAHFIILVYRKI